MERCPGLRRLVPLTLTALLLGACGGPDPDREIRNGGVFVDGWRARFDTATAAPDDVRFVAEDGGFAVQSGPNVILWNDEQRAAGSYELAVTVSHLDSHGHPHGAGLIFGAAELADDAQAYTYFLVNDGGRYLIKKRTGAETAEITPWTEHEAIVTDDGTGVAVNRLAVRVGAEVTRFLINGQVVHEEPGANLRTDGLYGFRVVHNLDIRLTDLTLRPGS